MIGWRHLRLTHKAGLLAAGLLILCSATATLVSIRHFGQELYKQEYRSAFTVYVAAANYLVGHYKSRNDTFAPKALSFVIGQRLLVLEREEADKIADPACCSTTMRATWFMPSIPTLPRP